MELANYCLQWGNPRYRGATDSWKRLFWVGHRKEKGRNQHLAPLWLFLLHLSACLVSKGGCQLRDPQNEFSVFTWISFLIPSLPRFVISDAKFWWLNSKEASSLCGIKVTLGLNRWSLWNDLLSVVTLCSKDLHDVCELFALILSLMNEFSYIWDKLLIFLFLLIELYCAAALELAPCRAVLSLPELL